MNADEYCHPERTREGSASGRVTQILREYAQDDNGLSWLAGYNAQAMNLHRNNAAEWVLWAALLPLVPVVWVIERLKSRTTRRS